MMTFTSLNDLSTQAEYHTSLSQLSQAEHFLRQILITRTALEGADASVRDKFNLAAVMVQQQKFAEAEPLLRQVLQFLQGRDGAKREMRHWVDQEVATTRLLGLALKGQGKVEEARELRSTAQVLEERLAGTTSAGTR
jgi:tetratricopeptide (TPR) repeat protein